MRTLSTQAKLALNRLKTMIRPNVKVSAAPRGIRVAWDVPVKVRDGTVLRVNVFRPEGDAKVPVILSAHPYGKDKIPANTRSGHGLNLQYHLCPQPEAITLSAWTGWEAPDPAVWVPRGYAVINADLRGCGTSDGVGELLSEQEARDYYDLIEWAGTQPWSTGRVGLDGVSYLAISQYRVAALRPPHLAAICPWEGFSDLYRDFAYPGGVREDGFTALWSRAVRKAGRLKGDVRREVLAHPELDDWYTDHDPTLERIEVPMLVCGSFSDHSLHTRGSFEAFRRAASKQKWLYTHRGGKWSTYYGEEATTTRCRFFDHFLKGESNGWADEPRVRLAVHDAGPHPVSVSGEQSWPPEDLTWRKLALDAGSQRMEERPGSFAKGSVGFDVRGGAAAFTWTVPENLDLIGPMALRVYVEMQGAEDVLLFAGVRKLRGGQEVLFEGSFGFCADLMSKGWQRAAHRALDQPRSLLAVPVHQHVSASPLCRGEIVPVDVALLPQATRLLRGDVLRVEVRGRWHFPRNPLFGQFPTWYQGSQDGTCVLHTGDGADAYLLLGTRPVD